MSANEVDTLTMVTYYLSHGVIFHLKDKHN